jgi:hypothetical protein
MKPKASETAYYDAAYVKAASVLKEADPAEICAWSGARARGRILSIRCFEQVHSVSMDTARFEPDDLSIMEKVLVLRYLAAGQEAADGGATAGTTNAEPQSGHFVSYEALPNGMFYSAAFRRFGPAILLRTFGDTPDALAAAAEALGAEAEEYGDCSVRIRPLPHVAVIVVMHRGDDEFPPEVKMLFRDDIVRYLSLEDVSRLGGALALRLAGSHRSLVRAESAV